MTLPVRHTASAPAVRPAAPSALSSLKVVGSGDAQRTLRIDGSHAVPLDVATSYDGSNVVYRLLRLGSWGPALMNLGYYTFRGPLVFLNAFSNLEFAQRRLVMKSIDLLQVDQGHRVLDVACGRGKSSFIMHCLHPEATVIGLDLLERNVQVARTLFDQARNLSYVAGSAMDLDFPDSSFDRVLCVEAAFHFPDRGRFLREACRVLRPGGRLTVVDFAWTTDADRVHRDDPETLVVREVWQFDDMFSIPEYERVARDSGLRMVSQTDWSSRVTHPVQGLFKCLSVLGNRPWGRRLLNWRNPLFQSISPDDWRVLDHAVRSHDHTHRHSRYMAFVFEKP